MKWLDRVQEIAASAPESGTKSLVCAGIVWLQVILSVVILFIGGIVDDFCRRGPRPNGP